MEAKIERIPVSTDFFCEAVCTDEILLKMIKRLEEPGMSQRVVMDISASVVTFNVGDKAWVFKYKNAKVAGTRGLTRGERPRATFIMPHLDAMKQASSVAPCLLVCLLYELADSVMMRFFLKEFGDLVFIYKAEQVDRDYQPKKGSGSHEKKGGGSEEVALKPDQAYLLGIGYR